MSYFNVFSNIEKQLQEEKSLSTERIPLHAPSSAMCYSLLDGKPIGTCIRAVYLKHARMPVSNPMGVYVKMTTEAGKLWEAWIIDRYKRLGVYVNHSNRVVSLERGVAGEIDIVHLNPETNQLELSEIKQYNGSNYYAASDLKGNSKKDPKPKDQNLLQSFDYLLTVRNTTEVSRINLVYIDRSCGNFSNNVQFIIEVEEIKNTLYPKITYFTKEGETKDYIDFRISAEAIDHKRSLVDQCLELETIPPKDYKINYTHQEVELAFMRGEISKSKYQAYREDPIKNNIGDWNCRYCPYGPGTDGFSVCESLEES